MKGQPAMLLQIRNAVVAGRAGLGAGCLAVVVCALAAGGQKGPIKKLRLDPAAAKVDFFQAADDGQLELRMVLKDAHQGNLLIENKSSQPLTVKLPEAFVGVHVLKQAAGGFFPQATGANNGNAGPGQGQGQPVGAGANNQAGVPNQNIGPNNGAGPNNPFNNFFSIPAEKVVLIPLKSVCLAYGRPDPLPRMTYAVVPLERHTSDPVLQELLKRFGAEAVDQMAVQAAAWHLADKLSWEQVAAKEWRELGSPAVPYFTADQIKQAKSLVAAAEERAKTRENARETASANSKKQL
jgi:hypothetical protein